MKLNDVYENIYNEWQDVRSMRMREGDYNQEAENIHIGRINCRIYKDDICDRIVLNAQKLPKFLILNNDTSYEFRGTLLY